jgi:hypothetical protein
MKLIDLRRIALLSVLAACSSSEPSEPDNSDDQTPPTSGQSDMESWLAAASYKDWSCEPTIHESRSPSPHGFNRICSNGLISSAATGTGAWPKGSAAVKEIYASATATTPVGYAVYLKTEADSAGGANWYWYERLPGDGLVAEGNGDSGPAKTLCVSCHVAAGADAAHTPTVGGRDQVYTPVP